MSLSWRLLRHGAGHGAFNMGVDEALLASASKGIASLRFYRWAGPWLSIGYAQRLDPACIAACAKGGVGLIRRVTGGRAVLHGGDLTYCVAAPEAALPAGLRASYSLVADALIVGLRSLGVAAIRSAEPAAAAGSGGFDCFAAAAQDEICVMGRKLAGNAQRRARGGVLQHGSIRLIPDPAEQTQALGLVPGVATSLAELGVTAASQEVQEALLEAFRHVLSGNLVEADLTVRERCSAEQRVKIHREDPLSRVRIP